MPGQVILSEYPNWTVIRFRKKVLKFKLWLPQSHRWKGENSIFLSKTISLRSSFQLTPPPTFQNNSFPSVHTGAKKKVSQFHSVTRQQSKSWNMRSERVRETGNIWTHNTSVHKARASSNGYYRKAGKKPGSCLCLPSLQIKSTPCPFICYVVLPRQRKNQILVSCGTCFHGNETDTSDGKSRIYINMIYAFGSTFGFNVEDQSPSFSPGIRVQCSLGSNRTRV